VITAVRRRPPLVLSLGFAPSKAPPALLPNPSGANWYAPSGP